MSTEAIGGAEGGLIGGLMYVGAVVAAGARGRLWLNDGSCIRLRPQHRNHVWSYDFLEAQTHDGRKLRLMTLIDEFTRECLAIRVARRKLSGWCAL